MVDFGENRGPRSDAKWWAIIAAVAFVVALGFALVIGLDRPAQQPARITPIPGTTQQTSTVTVTPPVTVIWPTETETFTEPAPPPDTVVVTRTEPPVTVTSTTTVTVAPPLIPSP